MNEWVFALYTVHVKQMFVCFGVCSFEISERFEGLRVSKSDFVGLWGFESWRVTRNVFDRLAQCPQFSGWLTARGILRCVWVFGSFKRFVRVKFIAEISKQVCGQLAHVYLTNVPPLLTQQALQQMLGAPVAAHSPVLMIVVLLVRLQMLFCSSWEKGCNPHTVSFSMSCGSFWLLQQVVWEFENCESKLRVHSGLQFG